MENIQFNSKQIDKINNVSSKEKSYRIKNLERFQAVGFPNKKLEDWKFSDFKTIVDSNFKKLDIKNLTSKKVKINLLKDFEHNYIYLVNGSFYSSNFKFEDDTKVKVSSYDKGVDNEIYKNIRSLLKNFSTDLNVYLCMETREIWEGVAGKMPRADETLDNFFEL